MSKINLIKKSYFDKTNKTNLKRVFNISINYFIFNFFDI